jgi:hypothetical protein
MLGKLKKENGSLGRARFSYCYGASMLVFIQEKYKWNASRFDNLQPDLAVTCINQTNFLCGGA